MRARIIRPRIFRETKDSPPPPSSYSILPFALDPFVLSLSSLRRNIPEIWNISVRLELLITVSAVDTFVLRKNVFLTRERIRIFPRSVVRRRGLHGKILSVESDRSLFYRRADRLAESFLVASTENLLESRTFVRSNIQAEFC